MGRVLVILVALALSGCHGGAEVAGPPAELVVGDLRWTATVTLSPDSLRATATGVNQGTEPVLLPFFGGFCSLLLRFYSVDPRVVLLDEAPPNLVCPDVGGEVRFPPGVAVEIVSARSLADLRAAGLAGGTREVGVLLPSLGWPLREFSAGRLELPTE